MGGTQWDWMEKIQNHKLLLLGKVRVIGFEKG